MKSLKNKAILLIFICYFISVRAECDSNDNKCLLNNICVDPTQFNLRPSSNVGPINCVKKCGDSECFHPTLFKCVATTSTILATEIGMSCICKEETPRKCIDPTLSSDFCKASSSGKVSNEDGLQCTTTCNDKNKCINNQFICQSPTDQLIAPANGSTCIAVNDLKSTQCYHPVLFVVSDLFSGVIQSPTKSCKCVNDSNMPEKCFSRSKFRCNVTSFRHLAKDLDGGECVISCPSSKCFKTENEASLKAFVCYSPAINRISNNDGSVCSTTNCKDKNSCFDANYTCVNTGSITILGDGSSCTNNCPNGTCKNITSNRCIKPIIGSYLLSSQNNCQTQCPANTCLHPISLKCLSISSDYENVDAKTTKTCICVNKTKCLDPDSDNCIAPISSKISDGDGTLCKKNNCTDKTKCINRLTFNCVKSTADPVEFKSINNDGGECFCSNSDKCLDSDSNCVSESSGKIVEGDGSYCRATNCINKNKCVSNFKCLDLNSTTPRVSNGDGGACLAACATGKCYNPSTLHCIDPKNKFVLKQDNGGACSNNICLANFCWSPNSFQCIDMNSSPFDVASSTSECACPSNNCVKSDNTCDTIDSTTTPKRLSASTTTKCLTKCPNGMCFHPLNGVCKQINSSIYSLTEGGECLCVNKSKCLSRTQLDPNYSCIDPNTTNISNGDGSLCELDTSGCKDKNKCYITTGNNPYKCITTSISFISKNDGKFCSAGGDNIDPNSVCDNADLCLNEVSYNCVNPTLIDNLNDSVKVAYCECDAEYCIHPTSSVCVKPTTLLNSTDLINDTIWRRKCKTLSEGCSGSQCIIPQSKSTSSDFRKCISTGSGIILDSVTKNCFCEDLNKCFDLDTNTCITPTINKISDGDGSICKKKCSNSLFCFNPVTYICQNPDDFSFKKVSSGSECICSNSQQCIDTDGICKSPSSLRISDNNGTICKTKCTNTKKCYNSNYLCIDGQESNIVNDSLGGSCVSSCSTNTQCYHPSTYICQTPGTGMDSTTLGDKCKCTNTDECIRNNTKVCSAGAFESGIAYYSNSDGYQCVNSCSDMNKCIDNNKCITPTTNKYSLGNGSKCETACPSNKCLSNDICVEPSTNLLLVAGSTECKPTCQTAQCRHPSKYECLSTATNFATGNAVDSHCICDPVDKCIDGNICITPEMKKLSNNSNGSLCISECPENFCIHPTTFKCTVVSADLIAENGLCVCSNKFKCIDGTTCIDAISGKFSYGNGGLCTNLNYDSNNDTTPDTFRCLDFTKCVDNFTCITPTTGKISRNDGLACATECLSDDCYHPSTFVCQNKNFYLMESVSGGECKCVNKKHCINSTSKWCTASQLGKHVVDDTGGLCASSCGVDKCYDEITNTCHSGSPSIIINSDGAVCATSCLDVSKCYSPVNFKCITPTGVMATTSNGGLCKCVDDVTNCLINSLTCEPRTNMNCALKSWYEKTWVKSLGTTTVNSVTTSFILIESIKMNTTISTPANHSEITSKLFYVERSAKNTSPELSIELDSATNGDAQFRKYLIDIYSFSPFKSYVVWDVKVFLYTNQGVELDCYTNNSAHLIQYKIKFFRDDSLSKSFYDFLGNEVDKIRSYHPSEFRTLDTYHNKLSEFRIKDTNSKFASNAQLKEIFLKGPSYMDTC